MEIRDRNYLKDTSGNILKIVGDYHPDDAIISYIKYFPSKIGVRDISGIKYGYNSFVSKSFVILQDSFDRAIFSKFHGGVLTCTPINQVESIFSCREKLKDILNNKEMYQSSYVGSELIDILEEMNTFVDLNNIGITGSFLIDAYNANSDIDFVCYGEDTARKLIQYFQNSKIIQPYEGKEAIRLYTRRMIHMAPMDFKTLIKQENRKLQGITKKGIHVNCQPLREDVTDSNIFSKLELLEIGEISCIAKIVEDSEGIYSPAYYRIEVTDIIDSLFSDGGMHFHKKIKCMISYIGAYSCSFKKGDKVFIQGKLVEVTKGNEQYLGIELTPWNTTLNYKVNLLN